MSHSAYDFILRILLADQKKTDFLGALEVLTQLTTEQRQQKIPGSGYTIQSFVEHLEIRHNECQRAITWLMETYSAEMARQVNPL